MTEYTAMLKEAYGLRDEVISLYEKISETIKEDFIETEEIAEYNQLKVLKAFSDNKVSTAHFISSNGYGYDDMGRETLDKVYAQVFGCEDAMVRHNIVSGTHALSLCMFGILRPGDTVIAVSGKPYDTLEEAIGIRGNGNKGSLKDFGVNYKQVDLKDGGIDYEGIKNTVTKGTKMVMIQKSKGYDWRPSLTNADIEKICKTVKEIDPNIICMVDNCYGEFTEKTEPVQHGADIMAGSLIKNAGGGIAQTGGYIAGREDLVELISYKLNSVGLGKECGATLGLNREFFLGFFMAPHIVCQAIKTAIFAARIFSEAGYEVNPLPGEKRTDIIQAVKLNSPEKLIGFCQGVQAASPVDSYAAPMPYAMPGYADEVIMAAGAFTQGASIEISADGPLREPYTAYLQGGLTFESGKVAVLKALNNI
ncbi:MAG: methionine gamma-lyase family protein [Eubacteriales bacterium]|nr:methionine gamma-lyase family protein [Eubacteriales bacterium]